MSAPATAAPKLQRADDDDDGEDDDGAVDGAGAFVFEEDDEGSEDEPLDMAVRACASAEKAKQTRPPDGGGPLALRHVADTWRLD